MKLAGQMTKPIQLLGWKQMKQVVANTSRIEFLKLASACLSVFVSPPVLIATPPHPPAKTQNHQNLNAGSRDKNAADRQTDTKTNQLRPTPSFCVRQLFLSFFISFSIFLSFFLLSFFFLLFLFFFLTSLLSFFSLSFFLAFFLFVFLNYFCFFSSRRRRIISIILSIFLIFHSFSHSFSLFNISLSCHLSFCILSFVSFVRFFLYLIFTIFSFFISSSTFVSLSLSLSIN